MTTTPDPQSRKRAHVERMLARAERRSRQTEKLIQKWKFRLAELDRQGVAAKQAKLFADEQTEQGSAAEIPLGTRSLAGD